MKRIIAALLLALTAGFAISAQDFADSDAFHDAKKLSDELSLLNQKYNASDPQAAVVYRILRCRQQIVTDSKALAKKDKLAQLDEAIQFGKPLLDKAKGTARDRAKSVYWYAVCISRKGQVQGVLNSLASVPEVRKLCDKCIGIDPTYGDSYYLKGLVDDAVPGIAGGDKNRMGVEFAKAYSCDPQNLWYIVDFACALKKRNKNVSSNSESSTGVSAGKSDLDYAKVLASEARKVYGSFASPTQDQNDLMDQLKKAGL